MRAIGTAARTRRSAASIPAATVSARSYGRTAIFAATSRLSGPMCSVRRWMTRSTSVPSSSAATIARSTSVLADSPISRLLVSTARMTATQASNAPIASDPTPSQNSLAGDHREGHAHGRQEQPGQRGHVLQQDGRQLRRLGPADEGEPAVPVALLAGLLHRRAQREALHRDGDAQHDERDNRVTHRLGVGDLVDALVDGEQAADGEQHDRDHEGVEVPLPAVPERVLLGPRAPRPVAAEQQQHLVAAVGDRVHGLGEHRRGAGDRERDELRRRDAQVGGERREHRPQRARLRRPPRPARQPRPAGPPRRPARRRTRQPRCRTRQARCRARPARWRSHPARW